MQLAFSSGVNCTYEPRPFTEYGYISLVFEIAFVTLFPAMQAAMIFKEGTTLAKRLLGLGYIYGKTDLFS